MHNWTSKIIRWQIVLGNHHSVENWPSQMLITSCWFIWVYVQSWNSFSTLRNFKNKKEKNWGEIQKSCWNKFGSFPEISTRRKWVWPRERARNNKNKEKNWKLRKRSKRQKDWETKNKSGKTKDKLFLCFFIPNFLESFIIQSACEIHTPFSLSFRFILLFHLFLLFPSRTTCLFFLLLFFLSFRIIILFFFFLLGSFTS